MQVTLHETGSNWDKTVAKETHAGTLCAFNM
jgi:hypothetical protein